MGNLSGRADNYKFMSLLNKCCVTECESIMIDKSVMYMEKSKRQEMSAKEHTRSLQK